MFKLSKILAVILGVGLNLSVAWAGPYHYQALRYLSPYSLSIGGATLPVTDETGNALFNNPAALAKNTKFKAEPLNLYLDTNTLSSATTKMTGLGGLASTLDSSPNTTYAAGAGNLTAFAWGGLGVGILFQERVRAYSTGTKLYYHTVSQMIPAVGYGMSFARGVVRVGYSLQMVSETSGQANTPSSSSASFLDGISEGYGMSHTLSGSITFPFTYLPTISLVARNVGNLHFQSGSFFPRGKNVVGTPSDQRMSLDASLNFMVRVSGNFKTLWFIEYDDATYASKMPVLEQLRLGLDLQITPNFGLRGGLNGTQYSAGVGYRSEKSEINLALYAEQSPLTNASYWDRRYALQYKLFFQDKNSRDRESEVKGK